jgi:hypothetical protein
VKGIYKSFHGTAAPNTISNAITVPPTVIANHYYHGVGKGLGLEIEHHCFLADHFSFSWLYIDTL